MVSLRLSTRRRHLTLLCLGAHSDDIEIGCGGTILQLLANHPRARVHWIVFSAPGRRGAEARRSATRFLRTAGHVAVSLHEFRDGFFPHDAAAIKEVFESLKPIGPDLVLTHHGADRHQDHRVVSELTWNTFRDHLILEYEIPKYEGDLGQPNMFVPLSPSVRRRKIALLMSSFPSQRQKRWFTQDTFEALLRLRGIESGTPTGYAEAFHVPKCNLEI